MLTVASSFIYLTVTLSLKSFCPRPDYRPLNIDNQVPKPFQNGFETSKMDAEHTFSGNLVALTVGNPLLF